MKETQGHPAGDDTTRLWRWRRNPLRRGSDRCEAWIGLAAGLAIAVVAPTVGMATATGTARAMLEPGEDLHRVAALVVGPAPAAEADDAVGSGGHDRAVVTVSWVGHDGIERTGAAWADADTLAGERVNVWTDAHSALHQPPVPAAKAWAAGVLLGASATAGISLAAVSAHAALRHRLDAHRAVAWEREWARVAPTWSRNT